jgi:hypothetical protein
MSIVKPSNVVFNVRVTLSGQYTYRPSKEVYLLDVSVGSGRGVVNNVSDFVARRRYGIFLNRPVCGLGCKAKFATASNF